MQRERNALRAVAAHLGTNVAQMRPTVSAPLQLERRPGVVMRALPMQWTGPEIGGWSSAGIPNRRCSPTQR